METPPTQRRTVFFYEHDASQHLQLVALGETDEALLSALQAFIDRRRQSLRPKEADAQSEPPHA